MNGFNQDDFEFVICAYKESPYLEDCICSLLNQSIPVKILLVTSTPNVYIEELVKRYHIKYYVNTGKTGIAEDWNFGLSKTSGKVVTIAHQDDIYDSQFARKVLENINKHSKPLIAFSDYGEIRNGEYVLDNKLLNTKRLMLFPLRFKILQNIRFIRRRILSFGSPICCPSVTFIKENLPKAIFVSGYRSDVDWQAWEKLSKLKGAFVYCKDILMFHRIHEDSATTAIIADNDRTKEDYEMFCRFWPKWMAKIVEYYYSNSEKSNDL
ncbi:MAG: glycosyltransferase family 2 protein [Lachnospiraceae bacterium]|nr:glycosyltransferase family 2 protein [Lachnospiraceae bacterium]